MRDIYFKAKRADSGEWVEGFYFKYIKPINGEIKHRIFVSDSDGVTWYEVEENTICQYTGLTDKNGNKIWENDILNIVYSNAAGEERYANGYIINDLRTTSIIGWLDYANEIEVIGNTFDNADLLKGE